MKHPPNLKVN